MTVGPTAEFSTVSILILAASVIVGCGSNGVNPSTETGNPALTQESTTINETTGTAETGSTPPPSSNAQEPNQPATQFESQATSQSPEPQSSAAEIEQETAQPLSCNSSSEAFKTVFLTLINDARAQPRQCGNTSHDAAPAVSWSPILEQAAQRHSEDMASRDFFSHTGSDNTSVADRVDTTGYPWQQVGENIAAGQTTAEQAMRGWLESPGHCRNIMNSDYADIAVTCATNNSTTYSTYWTNVFGKEFD